VEKSGGGVDMEQDAVKVAVVAEHNGLGDVGIHCAR
jgi:hypothetical protein